MTAKEEDKNHNPRKGTETSPIKMEELEALTAIRTIIPARGRKLTGLIALVSQWKQRDKNHNPRKGTETPAHGPLEWERLEGKIRTIIPARGRKHELVIVVNRCRLFLR